ncbi:MAG: hypothetical protein RJQ04_13070 [Longimicrobiales bacterium]
MKPPLAILDRPHGSVTLREGGGDGPGRDDDSAAHVFDGRESARSWLAYWLADEASMSRLRQVLHECGSGRPVARSTDHQVVEALADLLVSGALQAVETGQERDFLDVGAAFRQAAAAALPAPQAPVPPPPPPVPAAPPLLPRLEEVQIEGAEVLREILQTLEQVEASLGSLELASVSLEPTPSAVLRITAAMTAAAGDVTDRLGAL